MEIKIKKPTLVSLVLTILGIYSLLSGMGPLLFIYGFILFWIAYRVWKNKKLTTFDIIAIGVWLCLLVIGFYINYWFLSYVASISLD